MKPGTRISTRTMVSAQASSPSTGSAASSDSSKDHASRSPAHPSRRTLLEAAADTALSTSRQGLRLHRHSRDSGRSVGTAGAGQGPVPNCRKGGQGDIRVRGSLTVLHPNMALVLVYFPPAFGRHPPAHCLHAARADPMSDARRISMCTVQLDERGCDARGDFAGYFDALGLAAMANESWQ